MQDQYPSDTDYTDIIQSIYQGGLDKPGGKNRPPSSGVAHDQVTLEEKPQIYTRAEIVTILLDRYAADLTLMDGSVINCKTFLWNTEFSSSACLTSLYDTDGYDAQADWDKWAGLHQGHWYRDRGDEFEDAAFWARSRLEGQHNGGTPYKFQDATFLDSANAVKRRGWNQSHEDVKYVWGWDPKDSGDEQGWIGAHLGFRHDEKGANCLFWFTPYEVFFEAVRTFGGLTRRISVGYGPPDDQYAGRGQWVIDPTVTAQPTHMRQARPSPPRHAANRPVRTAQMRGTTPKSSRKPNNRRPSAS